MLAHEIVENSRKFKRGINTIVYNFFKSNEIHSIEKLVNFYIYKENKILPAWKIGTDKKEINGYICQEAKANYLGREWTVYFTKDIPINQGPWKLWGTPGLIVEAFDKEHLFSFKLDGFEVLDKKVTITYNDKTISKESYIEVAKKEFQKIEKLFYADFVEFTRLFIMEGKGTIHLTQPRQYQQFKEEGGLPYIPLEPW